MTRGGGRMSAPPEALSWEVNGLHIEGLAWGEPDGTPVLALHGWLDNAASFTHLAPRLSGCRVVALDLTGHGRSAHRSGDATYQIWDDLPEILGVLDALGWERFVLLGHSRGAIISTLLAAAYPERVTHLVLLDAVAPDGVPDRDFPGQLRRGLDDKRELLGRAGRRYADLDAAAASRERRGLTPEAARLIVERNLRSGGDGVNLTTDARLQGASLVKLTAAQIKAVLGALEMPTLLLLAADTSAGQWAWMEEYAYNYVPRVIVEKAPGGHHFHMEDGVDQVAERLLQFLDRGDPR